METRKIMAILVLALVLIVCQAKVSEAASMGTAFTYQGQLIDANEAADGEYDFEFTLYDANTDGNQIGWAATIAGVDVVDGYFTVELFLGSASFDGDARWLEIGVRPGELEDPNVYTILEPRQEVTPTPYAMYAERAGGGDNLGNHTATQNINLNGNYLSGDGGDEGVYVANDGKVGIGTSGPAARLELIQNTWSDILKAGVSTSPNRLILSSGSLWASISGGTTNQDHIVIRHSTGNVGIGTSGPDAKLEVGGDLKVTGAYKGNISSSSGSDGAPFPRPAYDSGWVAIAQNESKTLTHNIGGNVDNYVVDLQFKEPVAFGVNNFGYGGLEDSGFYAGGYYRGLTTTSIKVIRATHDITAPEVRVRIWVYN